MYIHVIAFFALPTHAIQNETVEIVSTCNSDAASGNSGGAPTDASSLPVVGADESEEVNEMPLPNFSGDIESLLKTDKLWSAIDRIIEQTAFWVLAHGDMMKKDQYDNFGQRFVQKYPLIKGHPDDNRPYSFFLKKLSRKLRNLRDLSKKRSEKVRITPSEQEKKKRRMSSADLNAAAGLSEDAMYKENLKELKLAASNEKPDAAKIKLLMAKTFNLRRLWLDERVGAGIQEILDKFPVLVEAKYVSINKLYVNVHVFSESYGTEFPVSCNMHELKLVEGSSKFPISKNDFLILLLSLISVLLYQ